MIKDSRLHPVVWSSCAAIAAMLVFGCGGDEPLRAAGSVLTADPDVGFEFEPGASARLAMGTHCGVETLDTKLNGQVWRTEETNGIFDWIPEEWRDSAEASEGPFLVDASLSADGTTLTLASNGRSLDYTAVGAEFADSDLCD